MPGPAVAGNERRHDPDRARPGDEHVLAGERELQGRVHGIAERVEEGGQLGVDDLGLNPHIVGGHHDVVGEGAIAVHAHRVRAHAHVAPSRPAVAAPAAHHMSLDRDVGAHLEALGSRAQFHTRADLDDVAVEFMADDLAGTDVLGGEIAPRHDLQVGSAQAGLCHADLDFPGPNLGLGNIGKSQSRAGGGLDQCAHITPCFSPTVTPSKLSPHIGASGARRGSDPPSRCTFGAGISETGGMPDIQYIIIAIVAIALASTALVFSTRRKRDDTIELDEKTSPYISDRVEPEEDEADEGSVATLEKPESVPSRMERLRARLARSGALGKTLLSILSRGDLTEEDWEEIEETLLTADVGLEATDELMEKLRTETKVRGTSDPEVVREILREKLLELVNPEMDRSLDLTAGTADDGTPHPATILVVGVNGTGKTTTIGKLARVLVSEDHTVVLGAADTFRAAAADQLATWGERVGVEVVRSDVEGADPASVAFDAVKTGQEQAVDVVMVDTAGRLQNKSALMDELGKIKRVMSRKSPVREVLLVIDATTGQNAMTQAKVFAEVTGLTGIVLTKLDGTAKGGIVINVQRTLDVPVKFVGLGEGPDDLAPFDPEGFVDALLN